MILKISTIEAEIIVDALIERIKKLKAMLNDKSKIHNIDTGSFYYEIECHNNLVKLMKEG